MNKAEFQMDGAKILAHRLKLVLPHIVFPQHSAFLEDMQIVDSVVVVHECLDSKFYKGKYEWFIIWIFKKLMIMWICLF